MDASTFFDRTQGRSLSTSQRGHSLVLLLVILFLLIVGGALYFKPWNSVSSKPQQIFCTQEAKICPDGSAVGRTGPNCEFSACPDNSSDSSSSAQTTDWKTYNDKGMSFKYPSTWKLENFSNSNVQVFSDIFGTFPVPKDAFGVRVSNPDRPYGVWADQDASFIIFTTPNLSPTQIVSKIQSKTQTLNSDMSNVFKSQTMTINGVQAELYRWSGEESYYWYALLTNGTKMVEIGLSSDETIGQVGNRILSTFSFTDQKSSILPTPTCFPRPACLDTTPRCMMPEPAEGWCK